MNVVDALVVTLGLDPSGFTAGAKLAGEASDRTKKQLASDAKAIEASGKQAAEFFSGLKREAIAFFAVVLGGVGLGEFVKTAIDTNATLGRLSTTMGVSTQALSLWQGAVKAVGGSADDATASIQSLVNIYQNALLRGQLPQGGELRLLGITNIGQLKDPIEALTRLNIAVQGMPAQRATNLLAALGITPAMIYLLEQTPAKVREYLEEIRKAGLITPQMADAALKTRLQITELTTSFNYLGNELLLHVLPSMNSFLAWTTRAAQSGELKTIIADARALGEALSRLGGDFHIDFGQIFGSLPKFLDAMIKTLTHIANAADNLFHGRFGAAGAELSAAGSAYAGFIAGSPLVQALTGAGRATAAGAVSAAAGGLPVGVLAGLFAESGLDPNAINRKSGAFGIGQWLGSRLQALTRFAAGRGKPVTDLGTQLAFVALELTGATGDAGAAATGRLIASGAADAAVLASMIGSYERPAHGAEYAGDIARGSRFLASHRSSSVATHIGHVHIYTQASDADGIAKSIGPALANNSLITQANTGVW